MFVVVVAVVILQIPFSFRFNMSLSSFHSNCVGSFPIYLHTFTDTSIDVIALVSFIHHNASLVSCSLILRMTRFLSQPPPSPLSVFPKPSAPGSTRRMLYRADTVPHILRSPQDSSMRCSFFKVRTFQILLHCESVSGCCYPGGCFLPLFCCIKYFIAMMLKSF